MRRKGMVGLVAALIAFAGCGDEGDSAGDERTQEAQQAVNDSIAAFQDHDFEAVCDLFDQRAVESITSVAKTDTCPEAYEVLFRNQSKFAGVPGKPFDEYVDTLSEYEAGEVDFFEEDGTSKAEVTLVGPDEASSFVIEEDGAIKVSELFVTPDANTDPGAHLEG